MPRLAFRSRSRRSQSPGFVATARQVGSDVDPDMGRSARKVAGRARRERGATTVELAAAIPLLAVVTLALVSVVALAGDVVLAQGAAREGAREAALSGDTGRAVAAARAALPPGRQAAIRVARPAPDRVQVEVRLPVRLAPGPGVTISASATAATEPGPPPLPSGP